MFILNAGYLKESSGTASVLRNDVTIMADTLDLNQLIDVRKFNLEIVPPSSGVQFYRNGIVFLSTSKAEGKMLPSHTSFGTVEAYFAAFKDTTLGAHEVFSAFSSWEIPCEAITFNSDYSVMYYTKKPSNKDSEKVYQAKYQLFKNGKQAWISDNKPLTFCNDKSVYSHPALSNDGEKMVFASNRSGSAGGIDLFISYKEGANWSSPINLGNLINTKGNELFPFLDIDNNLFFSSDGIEGFGGYDIYFCRYNGRGWDKPINLSGTINTRDDDMAFTLSRLDGKTAFYTTRPRTGDVLPRLFRVSFKDQYAISKIANLPDIFKYLAQAESLSIETDLTVAEKPKEVNKVENEPVKEPVQAQKVPETIQEQKVPSAERAQPPADVIIYRVQFATSSKSGGNYTIKIGGKIYSAYEYFYNGSYRSCAGEFTSPNAAYVLQRSMRQEGFPDAFVVAFRNNERLTGSIQSIANQQVTSATKAGAEPDQGQKQPEIAKEPVKTVAEKPAVSGGDIVLYRVQISASSKSKGSNELVVGGKSYKTYEDLNNGIYRLYVGEFNTIAPAVEFQNMIKKQGYPDAFIAVFKNNIRVTSKK